MLVKGGGDLGGVGGDRGIAGSDQLFQKRLKHPLLERWRCSVTGKRARFEVMTIEKSAGNPDLSVGSRWEAYIGRADGHDCIPESCIIEQAAQSHAHRYLSAITVS